MILPYAITIPVYSDPGHAWGAVKRQLLADLKVLDKVSPCSYQRGGMVYLEEDRDLSTVCDALRREGFQIAMEECGGGESSWVRSLPNFSPTLAPMPAGRWLVFIRTEDGPTLAAASGYSPLHYGADIGPEYLMSREGAAEVAQARRALAYRPIRASSKRAHELCLARGYTYSQPVRQARG